MKKRKKIIVISLGGSLIIPKSGINMKFLNNFKQTIRKHTKKYKFVIVCGGGSVARIYIQALKRAGKSDYLQSLAGIGITRINARFMSYFFNIDPEKGIPHDMTEIKNLLRKNNIIFCGALRYAKNQTSDATAAKLARYFNTIFINLTNVAGLYTSNPLVNKRAKFISKTSAKELYKRATAIKYSPGQHFVIDQYAAKIILNDKIQTYILGKNLKNLDNLLKNKKFKGTSIIN